LVSILGFGCAHTLSCASAPFVANFTFTEAFEAGTSVTCVAANCS
jgi:hypothetical protein